MSESQHGHANSRSDSHNWDRPETGRRSLPERLNMDPESVDRGLASLVLTVVELLRQLMERQALRRVDQGDLSPEQIEQIGTTLMILEERMTELREHFGLTPDDLNIDLGPLGPLLPEQEFDT
jgi:hypothetical protein